MYVVIVVGGNTPPTKIWEFLSEAEREAERLCIKENKGTYVAKITTKIKLEPKVTHY